MMDEDRIAQYITNGSAPGGTKKKKNPFSLISLLVKWTNEGFPAGTVRTFDVTGQSLEHLAARLNEDPLARPLNNNARLFHTFFLLYSFSPSQRIGTRAAHKHFAPPPPPLEFFIHQPIHPPTRSTFSQLPIQERSNLFGCCGVGPSSHPLDKGV